MNQLVLQRFQSETKINPFDNNLFCKSSDEGTKHTFSPAELYDMNQIKWLTGRLHTVSVSGHEYIDSALTEDKTPLGLSLDGV